MTNATDEEKKIDSSSKKQDINKRRRESPSSPPTKKKSKKTTTTTSTNIKTPPPTHTLIIDNGGDTLKYGWITDEEPRYLPNVTARLAHQITLLVGDELAQVQNPNSLIAITRSLERGLICNMANQMQVWKRLLDLLGVIIPLQTEAAIALGWKANKKSAVSKTIPSHSVAVVLLIPPHCPRLLMDQMTYVWMEDLGVANLGFGNSTVCASKEHDTYKTSCTIDLGWSSTWIVPTFQKRTIAPEAIRRLPLGGRHLINILKYYMSYRQYNLMDQEHLLRDVLEQLSFVSMHMEQDLKMARHKPSGRRSYDRDFVLPDYQTAHRGQIRIPPALQKDLEREAANAKGENNNNNNNTEDEDGDDEEDDEDFEVEDDEEDENDSEEEGGEAEIQKSKGKSDDRDDEDGEDDDEEETIEQRRKQLLQQRAEEERKRREQVEEEQVLRVSVERFAIPEILFRPSDAGLPSELLGLAPAIIQSIQACPEHFHAALYQSIHLVGGLSKISNLKDRLEKEVRELAPTEYKVNIVADMRPVEQAWLGAKHWFSQAPYTEWSIGREEWEAAGKRKAYGRLLMVNGGTCI